MFIYTRYTQSDLFQALITVNFHDDISQLIKPKNSLIENWNIT